MHWSRAARRVIGAATAKKLATLGADVAILGRRDNENARETCEAVEAAGRKAHMIVADMANPHDPARAVEETFLALGGIDILVHNAGGGLVGGFLDIDDADWNRLFDIHVHAAFHLCRAALPHMKAKRGGAVVFVSSVSGLRGVPNIIPYGIVKSSLIQFARGLAREFADFNIVSTASRRVSYGPIFTRP